MSKAARLGGGAALLAIVAGVGLLWSQNANAELEPADNGGTAPGVDMGQDGALSGDGLISANLGFPMNGLPDLSNATDEEKIAAFLYMIRCCEHVYPRDVTNNACYGIFYGGSYFTDFSDHPVITGEKVGVSLPAAMCVAAGYSDGVCVSTAAGAYQITKPTWNLLRAAGSWGPRLDDFSSDSQDEAARRLLSQIGALQALLAGDVPTAVTKASTKWASLPGSKAAQGPKTADYVVARFSEGLQEG